MLLVHISDLHFKKGLYGTALDPYNHIRNELNRDVKAMCEQIGVAPDGILVTGDLAYSGDAEEYLYAYKWLEEFCTNVGVAVENTFVVPGNHDVDRLITRSPLVRALQNEIRSAGDLSLEAVMTELLKNQESGQLLYSSIQNYNSFASRFWCSLTPSEGTVAKRDLVLNDGSTLRLWGLNSTFVSSDSDEKANLYIDPSFHQVIRQDGVENVVLCHHPYSWLKNGDALSDHLNDVTKIQLFGHEHTNRIERNRDYLKISASAGHPDRSEPGWEPGYNLLEINVHEELGRRRLELFAYIRIWQNRPGQFVAKMDGAESVFVHSIDIANWEKPTEQAPDIVELDESTLDKSQKSSEPLGIEMASLRKTSILFFNLSLSQKSAIAGKLDLLEDEDGNEPDFERFRRVLLRAKERNMIESLNEEILKIQETKSS